MPDENPRDPAPPVDLEIRITAPWGHKGRSPELVLAPELAIGVSRAMAAIPLGVDGQAPQP